MPSCVPGIRAYPIRNYSETRLCYFDFVTCERQQTWDVGGCHVSVHALSVVVVVVVGKARGSLSPTSDRCIWSSAQLDWSFTQGQRTVRFVRSFGRIEPDRVRFRLHQVESLGLVYPPGSQSVNCLSHSV